MSGLISLSANKATNGLKVNVVNTSNINLTNNTQTSSTPKSANVASTATYPEVSTIREEESIVPLGYTSTTDENPTDTTTSELTEQITRLTNDVTALKLIINILQDNTFYINKLVVADDDVLMEVIKLLKNADDIVMDAEDLGEGFITKKSYRKVNAIYVVKDGQTKNLKYSYPNIVQELSELHISFKFVW